ncbi:MAG: DUF4011 domain-containing protein [Deltaproteobacteria bacterium]|jgi:hypothetical protein|nr:DUF4011 domain-containing protein [Deltaproteobacteria bacterium]
MSGRDGDRGEEMVIGGYGIGDPGGLPGRDPAGRNQWPPAGQSRIDVWLGRLLDTTLRNSLLNYRQGRRNVELALSNPVWVEDRLYAGRKFRVRPGPELLKGRPDLLTRLDGSTRDQREALLCLSEDRCREHELLAEHAQGDVERRLLSLFRQARLDLEEGGANTLYLSLYRLRWEPARAGEPCEAPLVLVPVRLERARRGEAWDLARLEDEPRFNLTLLEMLRRDFKVKGLAPLAQGLPAKSGGLDIARAAAMTARAVRHLGKGWEVLCSAASLGIFSFAKHLIRRDLDEIRSRGGFAASPALSALSGERAAFGGCAAWPGPAELDRGPAPAGGLCPLPPDSSQLAAVHRAAAGDSFVLIGPPGTGKSQTIANMIARAIADGRRVLFVAEKAAALNVVHRRLVEAGLGDFCLELIPAGSASSTWLRGLRGAPTRRPRAGRPGRAGSSSPDASCTPGIT